MQFVIERSRAESKPHGYAVARNHYWIDLLLELPAVLVVLATGLAMLSTARLSPSLVVKVIAGLVAVSANVICVIPVARRKAAADTDRLADVIRYSRVIDRISVVGVPAGIVALMIGLFLSG